MNAKHNRHKECFVCESRFCSEDILNAHNTAMHTEDELYDTIVRIGDC